MCIDRCTASSSYVYNQMYIHRFEMKLNDVSRIWYCCDDVIESISHDVSTFFPRVLFWVTETLTLLCFFSTEFTHRKIASPGSVVFEKFHRLIQTQNNISKRKEQSKIFGIQPCMFSRFLIHL